MNKQNLIEKIGVAYEMAKQKVQTSIFDTMPITASEIMNQLQKMRDTAAQAVRDSYICSEDVEASFKNAGSNIREITFDPNAQMWVVQYMSRLQPDTFNDLETLVEYLNHR